MFRFSIRDLLLVTLVVGLCAGWWVHYSNMRNKLEATEKQTKAFQWESETLQRLLKTEGYYFNLADGSLTWVAPANTTLRIAVRPK